MVSTLATPEAPRVEENTTVFSTRTRNFNNRLGNGAQAYLGSADQANRSNQSEPIAQRLIKISEELWLKLADYSSNSSSGHGEQLVDHQLRWLLQTIATRRLHRQSNQRRLYQRAGERAKGDAGMNPQPAIGLNRNCRPGFSCVHTRGRHGHHRAAP